jgi:stage II sporulation protein GA (sporulation sigma-E factor processing peptidase)
MMNLLVLWTVGKLLKQTTTWLKLICAAALGALIICILVVFPFENVSINVFIYYVVTSLLMIFIGFRPKAFKQIMKLLVGLYLITFLIGGSIVSLYYYTKVGYYFNQIFNGNFFDTIDFNTFVFISLIAFIIIKMILHYISKVMTVQRNLFSTEIHMNGKMIHAQGLLDTGNNLYDPITNSPVMIVEYEIIKDLVPDSIRNIVLNCLDSTDEFYTHIGELCHYKFRLIPFNSIGKESGMLIGVVSESVHISFGDDKALNLKDIVLAIYNKKLSQDNSYQILLHPEMIRE